jgi:hypothetical protein
MPKKLGAKRTGGEILSQLSLLLHGASPSVPTTRSTAAQLERVFTSKLTYCYNFQSNT